MVDLPVKVAELTRLSMHMKTSLLSVVVALGTGYLSSAEDLPVTAWQGRTMGSPFTVQIVDGKLTEAQVNALKAEIDDTVKRVSKQMSNYIPESELSRFNQAAVKVPFKVSPEFARVTRFGLELSRLSDGAFDPTLLSLIHI